MTETVGRGCGDRGPTQKRSARTVTAERGYPRPRRSHSQTPSRNSLSGEASVEASAAPGSGPGMRLGCRRLRLRLLPALGSGCRGGRRPKLRPGERGLKEHRVRALTHRSRCKPSSLRPPCSQTTGQTGPLQPP